MAIPVIIDFDPGVDDIIALLLAIASPELEILALITSFGNTDLDSAHLNVLKAYRAIEKQLEEQPGDRFPNFGLRRRPLLVKGSRGPLEGDIRYAQYFHGRDGLGDITTRHPELATGSFSDHPYLEITDRPPADVTLGLLRSHADKSVTYVALGPLTNLANTMRVDSNLFRGKIGRIICMGGTLEVPGNTSPCAEFNAFADPHSFKELLLPASPELGLPLDRFILLPLDITTPHELPFPVYKRRVDKDFESLVKPSTEGEKAHLTHFTSSFLEQTRTVMLKFGKDAMELHDIVAIWCAISNPPSWNGNEDLAEGWGGTYRHFDIERKGELTRGMLVVDRRDDEGAYNLGANRSEVEELKKDNAFPAPATSGVFCMNRTPGPDALLELLLRRVWGA
ncbi:Inosine/uridine-preferring nucleoside hydrolase domain-containing protein [Mycena floridula]|nr:Inosine/uridine-preferring nucleoside hydrolase domain-containing protein [Mycena floridula]